MSRQVALKEGTRADHKQEMFIRLLVLKSFEATQAKKRKTVKKEDISMSLAWPVLLSTIDR